MKAKEFKNVVEFMSSGWNEKKQRKSSARVLADIFGRNGAMLTERLRLAIAVQIMPRCNSFTISVNPVCRN